jgi:hypothetical protein
MGAKVKAGVDEVPWTMTPSAKIKIVKDRDVGNLKKKEIVSLLLRCYAVKDDATKK